MARLASRLPLGCPRWGGCRHLATVLHLASTSPNIHASLEPSREIMGCRSRWSRSCRSHIPIYEVSPTTPLVSRQRRFSANWSPAPSSELYSFATLDFADGRNRQTRCQPPNIQPTQPNQKSVSMELCLPDRETLHFRLSGSRRRRRIGPRNSLGYLFGNVTLSAQISHGRPPFSITLPHESFLTPAVSP